MARTEANGIEIEYETFGAPEDPTVLLIAGLGQQLTSWPLEFCRSLAGAGYHVIRYDNRDAGLSSATPDDVPPPDWAGIFSSDYSSVPYRIADLADDAAALLDALGIESAHVAGVSMGGMICQQLAITRPGRIRSVVSVMSTTGDRKVGRPSDEATAVLLTPAPPGRAEAIAHNVRNWQVIGSPGHPTDAETLYTLVSADYDRSHRPKGTARQLAAIMASPDRTADLAKVIAPTLVVHGEDDPLIHVSGGHATHAAVPGSRLLLIPGMGHDLPRQLWGKIVAEIITHAGQADDAAPGVPTGA